jgi:hypothetical protein
MLWLCWSITVESESETLSLWPWEAPAAPRCPRTAPLALAENRACHERLHYRNARTLAEGSPGSWCGELGRGAVVYKKNASEAEVRTKSNGLVWQVVLRELAGAGNRSRHATRVRANPVLLRLVSRSKFRPEVAKRVTKSDKKCTPKHSWRVVEHNIKECANWLPHNDNSLYLKAIRSTPRRLINLQDTEGIIEYVFISSLCLKTLKTTSMNGKIGPVISVSNSTFFSYCTLNCSDWKKRDEDETTKAKGV